MSLHRFVSHRQLNRQLPIRFLNLLFSQLYLTPRSSCYARKAYSCVAVRAASALSRISLNLFFLLTAVFISAAGDFLDSAVIIRKQFHAVIRERDSLFHIVLPSRREVFLRNPVFQLSLQVLHAACSNVSSPNTSAAVRSLYSYYRYRSYCCLFSS